MILVIKVTKPTGNIIGLKEQIAARLEDIADIRIVKIVSDNEET